MNEIYAVDKQTNQLKYIAANLYLMKDIIEKENRAETEFYILGDLDMKYISRIVYVDGVCVYNNLEYWLHDESKNELLENYDAHEVVDFLGKPVDKLRFQTEMNRNQTRLSMIDGRAGQVSYNIAIGQEIIALFREECIVTDFKTITPLEIAEKLATAYSLVLTGSFREASYLFGKIAEDEFLTAERKQKYIAMLQAADAIEYATAGEYEFVADSDKQS